MHATFCWDVIILTTSQQEGGIGGEVIRHLCLVYQCFNTDLPLGIFSTNCANHKICFLARRKNLSNSLQ